MDTACARRASLLDLVPVLSPVGQDPVPAAVR